MKYDSLLRTVGDEPRPGIVYVATRRHAETLAKTLAEKGVRAAAYHAGLKTAERERIQRDFMDGRCEVIVATNAFGLGVDKPNVRFVFHLDMPDSVEAYYQEIGRGGRDGQPARALLFYRPQDAGVRRAMVSTGKIQVSEFERVAHALREQGGRARQEELQARTEIGSRRLLKVIDDLRRSGAAAVTPSGEVVAAAMEDPAEVVDRAARRREAFRQYRVGRVELMCAYAETQECRRRYILNYFGEHVEQDCGNCDRCGEGAAARCARQAVPFPLHARVRHPAFGGGTVMRYEGDSLVVLFDTAGSRKLALAHLQLNHLLELAA